MMAGSSLPASAHAAKSGVVPDDVVRMTHDFATCAVKNAPDEAGRLLARDFPSEAYRQAELQLIYDERICVGVGKLESGDLLVTGGLAEALLPRELAGSSLAARTPVDPAHPFEVRNEPQLMSVCMIRKSPDGVSALFATAPTSKEEKAAVQALMPTLVACVAKGQKVALSTSSVRAMLALVAYRMVKTYNAALLANEG
ncbi:hypothetical protein EAH87_02305 [Sphingomonas koreensis]|nr:hypothetical protein EAH87_02305 [Sphingomonas koreensis]